MTSPARLHLFFSLQEVDSHTHIDMFEKKNIFFSGEKFYQLLLNLSSYCLKCVILREHKGSGEPADNVFNNLLILMYNM